MKNKLLKYDADAQDWIDYLGDGDLFGGVTYSSIVNTDTDIQYGTFATDEIQFTATVSVAIGTELRWQTEMIDEGTFSPRGDFTVRDVQNLGNGRFLHRAYDFTEKFDRDVTRHFKSFLATKQNTPFTISDVIDDIKEYILDSSLWITVRGANDNYADNPAQIEYTGLGLAKANGWVDQDATSIITVPLLPKMPSFTARQILSMCAEICGCFCNTIGETEHILIRPFGLPRDANNNPISAYIPHTMRYMGSMSEESADAGLAKVVTVQTSEAIGEAQDPTLPSGTTANQYIVENNIFSAPDATGNINDVADNIYTDLELGGSLLDFGQGVSYRAAQMRIINDIMTIMTESSATISDPAHHVTLFVGTKYFRDPNGVYHLSGDLTEIADDDINTEIYAVSDESNPYWLVSSWGTSGAYLYVLKYTASGVQQTIKHTTKSVGQQRFRTGDAFYFDSATYINLYDAVELNTLSNIVNREYATVGTAFRINGNGVFELSGTVLENEDMSNHPNAEFYGISSKPGEGGLAGLDYSSGVYIMRFRTDNSGEKIVNRVIYGAAYAGRGYDQRIGIIMAKKIDKTGVTISSTGGEYRKDTTII